MMVTSRSVMKILNGWMKQFAAFSILALLLLLLMWTKRDGEVVRASEEEKRLKEAREVTSSLVLVLVYIPAYLIIVGDAADAVSVNFSARCKFSRLNAKIYHFTACVQ